MSYGGRYIRMAAGDPGFFSGLVKTVSKVVSPVAKVVGAATKIPVLGSVLKAVPGVGTAINLVGAGTQALGIAKKAVGAARGIGSPITKGPLMLGGKNLLPSRPGIGPVLLAGGATALGAAAGATMATRRPRTQAKSKRSRGTARSTSQKTRCGCKKGTRKVCFRTGTRRKASSGSRTAAQKRFAAAARRYGGKIPKGVAL